MVDLEVNGWATLKWF